MLLKLHFHHSISKLLYSSQVLNIVEKNLNKNINSQFPFINFGNIKTKSSLMQRVFSKKQHQHIFKLFVQYICNPNDKQLPFYYIQQNLRASVKDYLYKNDKKIKLNNFKVLSSEMVENMNIRGAFIHRKYNLNHSSYNMSSNQSYITYTMKNSLSSQATKAYEKAIRAYIADDMENTYYKSYKDFIQEGIITRYLYKIVAIVKLQMQITGKRIIVGQQYPCEHLLQIQSIVNRYSNLQEFYLTDIDFALKGNYYFKQRLY